MGKGRDKCIGIWISEEGACSSINLSTQGRADVSEKVGKTEMETPCLVSCVESKRQQDLRKETAVLHMERALHSPTEILSAQRGHNSGRIIEYTTGGQKSK